MSFTSAICYRERFFLAPGFMVVWARPFCVDVCSVFFNFSANCGAMVIYICYWFFKDLR